MHFPYLMRYIMLEVRRAWSNEHCNQLTDSTTSSTPCFAQQSVTGTNILVLNKFTDSNSVTSRSFPDFTPVVSKDYRSFALGAIERK